MRAARGDKRFLLIGVAPLLHAKAIAPPLLLDKAYSGSTSSLKEFRASGLRRKCYTIAAKRRAGYRTFL